MNVEITPEIPADLQEFNVPERDGGSEPIDPHTAENNLSEAHGLTALSYKFMMKLYQVIGGGANCDE